MVYSTSRCPVCGQVLKKQTNPVKEVGNPFERCRFCGSTYLNSQTEEWITKSPIKRVFLQSYVWARAIVVPMLVLAIPVAVFELSTDFLLMFWPILSALWLIAGYFLHKRASQEIIEASLLRTKDENYLSALVQAGYKIYPISPKKQSLKTSTQHTNSTAKQKAKRTNTIIAVCIITIACGFIVVLSFCQPLSNNTIQHTIQPEDSNQEVIVDSETASGYIKSVNVRMTTFDDEFTAEYVLAKFESGIGTETQIKDLMKEYGSANNDGTLQAIEPGWLVEELDTWCFDPTRQAGDIVIIENDYGFTLCYISSVNRQ